MFGLFLRNDGAVVADFYQDGFLFVTIGFYFDQAVFLLASDCLHGVFQQIQDNLRNQVLVRIDDQVGRLDADVDRDVREVVVMTGEFHHAFYELLDIEQGRFRRRDMREFPIRLHKRNQTFSGRADHFQAAAYIVVRIFMEGEERVAE